MNVVANILLWIFPTLFVAALVVGCVLFFVVRGREKRRREEFHRNQAQAVQHRAQEEELKKMKIDDL